jgi:hypothetical protein
MSLWDFSPAYRDPRTIQVKYEAWRATPDGETVYEAVRDAALRLRRRGFVHYGISALYEAARYTYSLRVGPDAEGWKLNNNWRSRMARELMTDEPELADFFELRTLRA